MLKTRVIPCLLLRDWGIEKSIQFANNVYIGSPINAVRIFNARGADEVILLDIAATREGRGPRPEVIEQIAEEASMPLTVGGGIRTLGDMRQLLCAGADRVAINTAAVENPRLLTEGADIFGRQCMVASLDARKKPDGSYEVYTHGGTRPTGRTPLELALVAQQHGAGEILLTSIDRDGTMQGYDVELVRSVAGELEIPVIASGGAGSVAHMALAVHQGKASAVSAGAYFLFFGSRKTVLITYPTDRELLNHLGRDLMRPKDEVAPQPRWAQSGAVG